jgi:hypothetical protein
MDNVVEFSLSAQSRLPGSREERERAEALDRIIQKSHPMSPEDQEQVAKALGRLLDRVSKEGIRPSEVLLAAGIGQKGDSTKHLPQYAIMPGKASSKHRLTKTPQPYRRIMEAVTELARLNRDEELLRLFDGTALVRGVSTEPASPLFRILANRLCGVAEAVASKHRLQEYFTKIERTRPHLGVTNHDELDLIGNRVKPEDIEIGFHTFGDAHLDWPITMASHTSELSNHDGYGTIPPYPAVVLGTFRVGYPVPLTISFENSNVVPPPFTSASGEYWAEIRFCIVPASPDFRPIAAFRINMSVTINFRAEDDRHLASAETREYPSPGEFLLVEVKRKDGPPVECRIRADAANLPDLIKHSPPVLLKRGHTFLSVDAFTCQDWGSLETHENNWDRRLHESHLLVLGPYIIEPGGASDFRSHTVAAGLDCILSGQAGPDLLTMLDERSERMVTLFNEAGEETGAARTEGYADLEARLRKMRGEQ